MKTSRPHIFEFLDAAQFLKSIYEWRKSEETSFSISKWAQELGIGSKVTLRFILNKQRNIVPKVAQALKTNLNLTDEEAKYFDILVSYSQAKTATQRESFGSSLLKLHRNQFKQVEVNPVSAAKHVFGPIFLTLLTFNDVEKTAENFAKLLNLKETDTQQALDELVHDGVISKNGEFYEFNAKTFRIQDHSGLRSFYEYWIDRSKQAMNLPSETRKYRALKFALSEEEFKDALGRINEHAVSLLSQYQSNSLHGRKLYMLESAFFPITTEFRLAEKSERDEDLGI